MSGRKFVIWLFSLLAVLVVYLLFVRSGKIPSAVDKTVLPTAVTDGNMAIPAGDVGMVGDVGVGTVRQAKYTHLNSKRQVDREFGFDTLLHEVGDEWEIEKPFMNVYRRDLKCIITADSGKVQVQTTGGRPTPKDASLNGNVVIHILPQNDSDVKESFIYLDDIVYSSERSQFSTDGPVKFINDDAQLLGRGLELVYNEQSRQLDLLRIRHLDGLRLRIPSKSDSEDESSQTASVKPTDSNSKSAASEEVRSEKKGVYYKCSLRGNVVIDAPEQLVIADEVAINEIFQSKSKRPESGRHSDANEPAAKQHDPNKLPQNFADINVTCDNGIIVTPMESGLTDADAPKTEQIAASIAERLAKAGAPTNKRAIFAARKIDYNIIDNSIVLDGDCVCTGLRQETGGQRKYTLSGQHIAVTLAKDKEKRPFSWAGDVDMAVAEGGVVQLATVRMMGEKILSFNKLKCAKFEFDGNNQQFMATGPGVIAIDNSKMPQPKEKVGKFGLRKQCYAVMRDFQTLVYSLESNKLIADSAKGGVVIDYFPVVGGKTGTQATITAGHIEASLLETADGRTELSRLSATEGVTYEEKDNQFVGSNLIYDAGKSVINIKGDKTQPCLLNGALVDGIRYDLKTEKFKAEIKGPGILRFK